MTMKEMLLILMLVEGGGGQEVVRVLNCGDVWISEDAVCVCGNKTIKYYRGHGPLYPLCCGHIHCTIADDGTGICDGGEV